MSTKFTVTEDLPRGPRNYADRSLKKGETVYRYDGCTYGCIAPSGIACCFAPMQTPFFEVAGDALTPREQS